MILLVEGLVTREDWEQITSMLSAHFGAEREFALAVRMSGLKIPEIRLLKEMGAWTRDHKDDVARYVVRSALCTSSAMARGALKFVNDISRTRQEQEVFADWDEALAWAREAFAPGSRASDG